MTGADALDSLRPRPIGGLGRGALLAILAHVLLILGLAFGVNWRSHEPEGVTAELWAAAPQVAAPAAQEPPPPPPEPTPQPRAVTPPPPPKTQPAPDRDADIAVEKAKREREKKRAEEEQERKEREAKARADKAREEEKEREKERREKVERAEREKAEKDKEIKAAKAAEAAREKQRAENLKRMLGQAGGTGAPTSNGQAAQSAGPSASYAGRIAARVKPNIVFSDDVAGNPAAEVEVRAAPDGTIIGRTLKKSSGVKAWDEAVLRAIDRTEVLPRDVDGRVPAMIPMIFRPRDFTG